MLIERGGGKPSDGHGPGKGDLVSGNLLAGGFQKKREGGKRHQNFRTKGSAE